MKPVPVPQYLTEPEAEPEPVTLNFRLSESCSPVAYNPATRVLSVRLPILQWDDARITAGMRNDPFAPMYIAAARNMARAAWLAACLVPCVDDE